MTRFKQAKDIRTGVIGYSASYHMGRQHLTDMKRAGMRPVAVAELDPKQRKEAEAEFPGIATYESAAAMLRRSDVNLVAVLTPHNTHAELAIQCLRTGRHVVCEKPFAITTAECDAMIREAERRGLMLSAYHNRHWDGCIMEAVNHIRRRKVIGDVFRIEVNMNAYRMPPAWWRSSKSISGGILYDMGAHYLEYAFQLIDARMAEVSGYAKTGTWAPRTKWGADTNEDDAQVVVRFEDGAWLLLRASSLEANVSMDVLTITGTRGTYLMRQPDYEIIRPKGERTVVEKGLNRTELWHRYYRNIADHLVKGTPLVITPEWARRPIHVLDLATHSARRGRAIKVKYV